MVLADLVTPRKPRRARRSAASRGRGGEESFQADAMAFLRLALPADAVAHHSPNEGRRGWRAQRALKSGGTVAGWPDVEVVWRGRAYFLELKVGRRKPSEAQCACHARLRAAGAEVEVCRTLDEVYGHVARWGIHLRVRPDEFRGPTVMVKPMAATKAAARVAAEVAARIAPAAQVRMTAGQFRAGLSVAKAGSRKRTGGGVGKRSC